MTLRHLRSLMAILIALSLVASSVASASVAVSAAMPMGDDGSDLGAMEDCGMAAVGSAARNCDCCDTKSKCPDAAACLKKCGSQIVGYLTAGWRTIFVSIDAHMRADTDKPPDWMSAPPAPPPRA